MKKTNFKEAKNLLSNSKKAGRLIATSDGNWFIEYLPDREKEYEIKKKAANEIALIKQKKELLEKEKLKKQKILIQKQKIIRENEKIKKEFSKKRALGELEERRKLIKEKENSKKELREEKIRNKIREKFSDAKIIIQYKRSGSGGKRFQFNEWGCWIIFREGIYLASHESKDRVAIAKKPKTKKFKNKEEAINYCKWLINHHWYSETSFFKGVMEFDDFPITKPLTEKERENAAGDFIPYVNLFS